MEVDDIEIARLFGIELEFFLTDRDGKIKNSADALINHKFNNLSVVKEAGQSMIELLTLPHRSTKAVFSTFIKAFENLLYEADVNDLGIFNFGTYPGINTTKIRVDPRYDVQENILGKSNFPIALKCIGYHFHYSLPRNVFDHEEKFLYERLPQIKKNKIISLYNLAIAIDPCIITFMQSSPFFEGRRLGKDSRVIKYRGDHIFDEKEMLYVKQPDFGALNHYKDSYDELLQETLSRSRSWRQLLEENGTTFEEYSKKGRKPSLLDTSWKPVKLTSHGTLEYRGADMNSMKNIVGMSTIIYSLLRHIHQNKIKVVIGSDPFRLEGTILYVPAMQTILQLQKEAAIFGLESQPVLNYCISFMDLIKKIIKMEMRPAIRPFLQMLEEKKTKSDEIIDYFKKKQGTTDDVNQEVAEEFAIRTSESIFKDILLTKKVVDKAFVY